MTIPGTDLATVHSRIESTEVLSKVPENADTAFIATHHGTFHADEAMACAMLKCLPEYASMPIVRTRNQADIDKAAVVVDVGGTYEPEKHRYDHHQRTFTTTYSEEYPLIKLSSAGLVYKHFGEQIVEALCGKLDEKVGKKILNKTYDGLVRELDALDNGVSVADEPRYRFVTHLGARIGRLNMSWQEVQTPEAENGRFKEAMKLAAAELCSATRGLVENWLPAREIVEESLKKRLEIDASGEVMQLPRFCPWQEHLFDLEEEASENQKEKSEQTPLVKYVLFQDSRAGWRIQAVPAERGSFKNRLPLPKEWCGVRDQQLSEVTGIPDCVFVHAAGFIGGNNTETGVVAMAKAALKISAEPPAKKARTE